MKSSVGRFVGFFSHSSLKYSNGECGTCSARCIDIFAMDTAGRGIGQLISANGHNKLFEEELGDFGLVEGNFTRRASLVDGVEIIGRTPSGNEYFNDWE